MTVHKKTLAEDCQEFRDLLAALWNEAVVKPFTPVVARLNAWLERKRWKP